MLNVYKGRCQYYQSQSEHLEQFSRTQKEDGKTRNQRENLDSPDYSVEIGKNT